MKIFRNSDYGSGISVLLSAGIFIRTLLQFDALIDCLYDISNDYACQRVNYVIWITAFGSGQNKCQKQDSPGLITERKTQKAVFPETEFQNSRQKI